MATAAAAIGRDRARAVIAADHLATRVGLKLALEPEVIVTEAAGADSAVAAAVRHRPDICVLDRVAAGRNLEAVTEIVARVPSTTVVVLAQEATEDEFMEAIRAGASGYLAPNLEPARLLPVVRGVLSGEPAVPRRYVGRLLDELRGRDRRRLVLSGQLRIPLTAREWDVLELLRQDMSTKEIAAQLQISQVTVRRHLSSVGQKLGASSRADVLRLLH